VLRRGDRWSGRQRALLLLLLPLPLLLHLLLLLPPCLLHLLLLLWQQSPLSMLAPLRSRRWVLQRETGAMLV
jgi:hypothetical protein